MATEDLYLVEVKDTTTLGWKPAQIVDLTKDKQWIVRLDGEDGKVSHAHSQKQEVTSTLVRLRPFPSEKDEFEVNEVVEVY